MSFSADSYDSDASFGLAGAEDPPGQVQNCYDRPSTADMNSTSFKPRSNEDDGSASGSGGDDSDEEPTAVAAPIEPRGKTFSPPKGVGDNNTSSSEEDEGDLKPSNSTNAAAANATAAPAANPNPSPPRGKELRRILKGGGDSSSDDELDEPIPGFTNIIVDMLKKPGPIVDAVAITQDGRYDLKKA